MNEIIKFNGMKGEIIEASPHDNYLVVKLSNRISICGTRSNIWNWETIKQDKNGFIGVLTYIGFNTDSVKEKYLDLIAENDGYCKKEQDEKRQKKRVTGKFKYEMKVRNLSPQFIKELVKMN